MRRKYAELVLGSFAPGTFRSNARRAAACRGAETVDAVFRRWLDTAHWGLARLADDDDTPNTQLGRLAEGRWRPVSTHAG